MDKTDHLPRTVWTEELIADRIVRIAVRGRLPRHARERLGRSVLGVAHGGKYDVVVDLTAVDSMDPETMKSVVDAARLLRLAGGRVSVVLDPSMTMLAVRRLEDLYDVAINCEDAVERLLRSPQEHESSR